MEVKSAQTSFEAQATAAYNEVQEELGFAPLDNQGQPIQVDTQQGAEPPPAVKEKESLVATQSNMATKLKFTDEDFNTYFKEKKGKAFDEYENELKQETALKAVEEAKKTFKPTFKSKFTEGLVDWEEKGGTREEYLKIHSTDWTKVSHDDLLKLNLKKQYEGLSDEDLDALYQDTYRTDEEKYPELTEQQIKIANIKKQTDAEKLRKEFISQQSAATAPASVIEAEKQKADAERKAAEVQAKWEVDVSKSIKDFSALDGKTKTTTGLEVEYKYEPTKEQKSELQAVLKDPNSIFDKYLNKDGKVDFKTLERDMFILKNMDTVLESVASSAEAAFVMKNLKNTDFATRYGSPVKNGTNPEEDVKSAEQKILKTNF